MAGFGYTAPRYGATVNRRTPSLFPTPLTRAAAGTATTSDPFGLTSGLAGASGYQSLNPFHPSSTGPKAPAVTQAPVSTPAQPFHETPQQPGNQQAPTPATVYDVNTDPVLQQVNAFTTMSDAQARAAATQQERDAVLGYGDPNLAAKLYGQADPLVVAARANPTSTLSRLSHQHDTSLHDLLDQLTTGGHNLGFSGYRTTQEGELGHQYQGALADAATGVNQGLGSIEAALAQALGGNQQSRVQALQDAYGRAVASALSSPVATNTDTSGVTDPGNYRQGTVPIDLERLIRTTRTGPFKAY